MSSTGKPMRSYAKFGAAKRARYLELIAEGYRFGAAAEAVGISRDTVRTYCNDYPEFAEARARAEMDAAEPVEEALRQNALGGNVVAQQVWLYNRSGDRWRDQRRQQHEVSGPGGAPVRVEFVPVFGDDDPILRDPADWGEDDDNGEGSDGDD